MLKITGIITRVCTTLFSDKNEVVLAVNEKIFQHKIYMKKLVSKIKGLEEWDQLVNKL